MRIITPSSEAIENFYLLWDKSYSSYVIARCNSNSIASEMANYCFGVDSKYMRAYSDVVSPIKEDMILLKTSGIKQGYVLDGNIIEYKSRIDIINELLDNI